MNEKMIAMWMASGQTREQAVVSVMRANLAHHAAKEIDSWNLTHRKAGKRAGIAASKVSRLLNGHTDDFSLTVLTKLCVRLGFDISFCAYKEDVKS